MQQSAAYSCVLCMLWTTWQQILTSKCLQWSPRRCNKDWVSGCDQETGCGYLTPQKSEPGHLPADHRCQGSCLQKCEDHCRVLSWRACECRQGVLQQVRSALDKPPYSEVYCLVWAWSSLWDLPQTCILHVSIRDKMSYLDSDHKSRQIETEDVLIVYAYQSAWEEYLFSPCIICLRHAQWLIFAPFCSYAIKKKDEVERVAKANR